MGVDVESGGVVVPITAGEAILRSETRVPPQVAHSFRTSGDRPARWLPIHAHDGGFAAFMRGTRDGGKTEWDISPVRAGMVCPQARRSSVPTAPASTSNPATGSAGSDARLPTCAPSTGPAEKDGHDRHRGRAGGLDAQP